MTSEVHFEYSQQYYDSNRVVYRQARAHTEGVALLEGAEAEQGDSKIKYQGWISRKSITVICRGQRFANHLVFIAVTSWSSSPSAGRRRSALGGHREKQDGLLTWSSFAPALVLASPLQRHVHVGVLPGAVGVVVVALQPLQEVALVRRSFL